jgi:hypothetical protein
MIGNVRGEDKGKGELPGLKFIAARKRVRGDRRSKLKVQLCHAMDQIVADVRVALEIDATETVVAAPAME